MKSRNLLFVVSLITMKFLLSQFGLLLCILCTGWRRLDRLDGPPLGRAILVWFFVLYMCWLGLPWIAWCDFVLLQAWNGLWGVTSLVIPLLLWLRLAIVWRQVRSPTILISLGSPGLVLKHRQARFGPLVLKRRGRMHPTLRYLYGIVLGLLLFLVLVGIVYTDLQQQFILCEVLEVVLWVCLTLLLSTILG